MRQHHIGTLEAHQFQVVGMRAGDAVMAHFDHAYHGHLHPFAFQDLKRLDVEVDTGRVHQVGTKERKLGPPDVVPQVVDIGIPLVVAQSTKVKTRAVHQLDHGVIDRIVLVVDGIARAVVARREQQHVGIDGT